MVVTASNRKTPPPPNLLAAPLPDELPLSVVSRISTMPPLGAAEIPPPTLCAVLPAIVLRSTSRVPYRLRMAPPSLFVAELKLTVLSRTTSELPMPAL